MAKAKSKATIMAAYGAGGMTKVEDRRFETGEWSSRMALVVSGPFVAAKAPPAP
jgi:hypothetical protein